MAADEFDKTEEPTPQKLKDARKKGQVSKSVELTNWAVLLAFTASFSVMWPQISQLGGAIIDFCFKFLPTLPFNIEGLTSSGERLVLITASLCLPVLLAVATISVLAQLVRSGFVFSTHPLRLELNKLNPVKGLKRMFERRALFEIVKSLLKIAAISVAVFIYVKRKLEEVAPGLHPDSGLISDWFVDAALGVAWLIAWLLLPFAAIDVLHSGREFVKKMRMSKREVKEEHKRNEGSPEVRRKRQELQRSMRKRAAALGQVKESDIIITNPTHYAVALRYDKERCGVPLVAVKGQNMTAARIRYLAKQYGKPILRRPELARALFHDCEIGDAIPLSSYRQVADVYRWLYSRKESMV